VTDETLDSYLRMKQCRPFPAVEAVVERMRNKYRQYKGKKAVVVQCSGCFDLIHPGHITYLQIAKSFGTHLVVSINSDERIRTLKGAGRPILDLNERYILLCALECVDLVVHFREDEPSKVIERVQPDLFVKGHDYTNQIVPEMETVFKYGAYRCMPANVPTFSTSELIKRVVDAEKGSGI
jgi:D-beta-D-heptose 7-phosphate kinase / D-beta-D-heptose 1-phosphate adenosyltransferase